MPIEDRPNPQAEGTPSAGANAGTDAGDKPDKVVIDGKEVSIDEVKVGLKALEDRNKWRSSLDKKGAEMNEKVRMLNDMVSVYAEKVKFIESELKKAQAQPIDPNSIDDPDERRNAEIKVLKNQLAVMQQEMQEAKQLREVAHQQEEQKNLYNKWTNISNGVYEEYGKDMDEDDYNDLVEKTEAKMGRIHMDKWTPEDWDENCRLSAEQIKKKRQKIVDHYGKTKGKKETTGIEPGSADTPKFERILPGDDEKTRLEKMKRNEEIAAGNA